MTSSKNNNNNKQENKYLLWFFLYVIIIYFIYINRSQDISIDSSKTTRQFRGMGGNSHIIDTLYNF
jgi:hypothetical protein